MILKTEQEIIAMQEAGSIVATILHELVGMTAPGITTKELDKYAEFRCKELHCTPAFKGYGGFPGSVCISVNEEAIHGVPSDRVIQDGDIVGLDFGVVYNGWYGDSAFTVPVGNVSFSASRLVFHTQEALQVGIDQCIAGNLLSNIGYAIESYVNKYGYGIVKSFVGHGIGRSLHEAPNVLNYGEQGNTEILQIGTVIAIEPILTLGNPNVQVTKDGWTVSTLDKSLAAHFEHTVAITETGPKILTRL